MDDAVGLTNVIRDEGLCELCRERPAEILGLVCETCKQAVDLDEAWTHQHEDLLFRLREAEAEEEVLGSEP